MNSRQPIICLMKPSREFIGILFCSANLKALVITSWGVNIPIFRIALKALWKIKLLSFFTASSYFPKFSNLFSKKSSNQIKAFFRLVGIQRFFADPGCALNTVSILAIRSSLYFDVLRLGTGGMTISLGSFFLLSSSKDHFPPIGWLSPSIKILSSIRADL